MQILAIVAVMMVMMVFMMSSGVTVHAAETQAQKNLKTVKEILAMFGVGDIDGVIKKQAAHYVWEFVSAADATPSFAKFDNLHTYMDVVSKTLKIYGYEVLTTAADKNGDVLTIQYNGLESIDTGKKLDTMIANWYHFDKKGKVIRLDQFADTAGILNMLNPGATAYDLTEIMTWYMNAWNERDYEKGESLVAEDAMFRYGASEWVNKTQALESEMAFIASFPDARLQLIKFTSDSTTSVGQYHLTGTFSGQPFMGVPANGKKFAIDLVDIVTIKHGKIVKVVEELDSIAFISQLTV